MKRKKPSEQKPADFKNAPFKALKGMKPAAAPAAGKPPLAPKKDRPGEDDARLFQQAVSGVRPIKGREAPPVVQEERKKSGEEAASGEERLFLQAMKGMGTMFSDQRSGEDAAEEEQQPRSSRSRMRQLKRGAIRISRELDLHGFLREEALARLAGFIADARHSGLDAVLVITGKGSNSAEGPVLQGAVAEWLRQKGRGLVAEFHPAPRDRGGTGAYVVFLKK